MTSGEGEPLVLLHGGEGHRGQFDTFRSLLDGGIRAISYDQRDTGDTRNGPEPYDLDRLADDCAGLVDALGHERVHVLGASFGGIIAMRLALRHPGRIASLTLVGTTPSLSMTEDLTDRIAALGPDEREQFMLDLVLSPEGRAADPELVAVLARALRVRPADAGARRAAAVEDHDCTARLAEITTPTLVLHGADDPIVRSSVAEFTATRIPGARLELLPRIRHGVTLEASHATAALVSEFVLSHATGSTRGTAHV
ncbi:alpha/beta fold hydrolase [Streptomyces yangpuensis]|uniref:alpha/beta fold hydrolase n=1 Tax=Streptomyces yangpuensis TaxID=1648182 RepID=UPI000629287C|nr:alpha/beta hydrolase [Streptomyces yangpuensis]